MLGSVRYCGKKIDKYTVMRLLELIIKYSGIYNPFVKSVVA